MDCPCPALVGTYANRVRLAIRLFFCSMANDSNVFMYVGKWSWSMNEALGDVQDPAPIYHNYRCCLDKLPGWQTAGKEQNTCADVASQTCTDIKADDIACRTGDVKTTAYFSVGYKTTDCNNYADDCRASLQCDTDAGFSGHADLACQSGSFEKKHSIFSRKVVFVFCFPPVTRSCPHPPRIAAHCIRPMPTYYALFQVTCCALPICFQD